MLPNIIAITTERAGALHTGSPVVRNRMRNPAKDIIRMIETVEREHGDVLAELGGNGSDGMYNVVLARFQNEHPHFDGEVAERLVRRTVDARLLGVV